VCRTSPEVLETVQKRKEVVESRWRNRRRGAREDREKRRELWKRDE